MRKTALAFLMILAIAFMTWAQDASSCKLPLNLERLSAKAAEVVDINMDENMLKFAGNFMNKNKPEEAQAQKIISGIKNLCVRSFEFNDEIQYSNEDLDALRAQLRAPLWSRMVGVRSERDKENVDVYCRMEKGSITGLAVIAAEPKELTVVHIDGIIDPSMLSKLGGQFGIPKVDISSGAKPAAQEAQK
jgi:hypothetical protein